MTKSLKSGTVSVAALLLLSLLWACGVLRSTLGPTMPASLPHLERQGISLAMVALVGGVFTMLRSAPWPQGRALAEGCVIGLGLFVVPALLIRFAADSIPPFTQTLLLMLVPIFCVVFEPYLGRQDSSALDWGSLNRGSLLGTLAAVAGALCVFSLTLPTSAESAQAFCAVVMATISIAAANCRAVAAAQSRPAELPAFTAIATGTATAVLFACSLLLESPVLNATLLGSDLIWSALIELPALLLLFWLLHRISAVRMATRYILAPLIAVILGAGLMRAPLAPRTWLGLLLMAGGAGFLLFAPQSRSESTGLSLR